MDLITTVFKVCKAVYDQIKLMKATSKECVELEARCSKVLDNLKSLTDDTGITLQDSLRRSISDIHECFLAMGSLISELIHAEGLIAKAKNLALAQGNSEKLANFNVQLDRLTLDLIAAMGAQGLKSIASVDRTLQRMHTDLLLSGQDTQLSVGAVSAKQDQLLDSQKFITKMLIEGRKTGSFSDDGDSHANSQGDMLRSKLQWKDAFEFYKCAALQEHDDAAAWCAYTYLEGLISPPDVHEAHKFALLSHRSSNAFGTACYASCLARGWGTDKNLSESKNLVVRAHNLGSTYASVLLADMYYHGVGVGQSYSDAVKYFRLAADKNDPQAQYKLGEMLVQGQGVPTDTHQAMKYLRESSKHGNPHAQSKLADILFNGTGGERANKSEACVLYREAAKSNDLSAQMALFKMLRYGDGVKQDLHAAFSFCHQAAVNHGRQDMQFEFGRMLWRSIGVERDVEKATLYFSLAAENGYTMYAQYSMVFLGMISQELRMPAAGKNPIQWWSKALSPAALVAADSINMITLHTNIPWQTVTQNPHELRLLTEPLDFVPAMPSSAPHVFQSKFVMRNGSRFIALEFKKHDTGCTWELCFQNNGANGQRLPSLASLQLETPAYLDLLSSDHDSRWKMFRVTSKDANGNNVWGHVPLRVQVSTSKFWKKSGIHAGASDLARVYLSKTFLQSGKLVDSYAVGLELLKIAADNGHPDSFFPLAVQYGLGVGSKYAPTPSDSEYAHLLFQKASVNVENMSDITNITLLALHRMLGLSGLIGPMEMQQGFDNLKFAASHSHLKATFLTAASHCIGFGCAINFREGARLFLSLSSTSTSTRSLSEKNTVDQAKILITKGLQHDEFSAEYWRAAAENGDSEGMFQFAVCLIKGIGIHKDAESAIHFLESASKLGHVGAQLDLGIILLDPQQNRVSESFGLVSAAAEQGRPEAQAKLGEMYLRGIRPAEMDSAQALRFLQPAASARVPLAMFLFGECLEHGVGTEADQKEATRWYGIAADSGHTEAQFRYAVCLEQGKGIAIDTKGAITYYSLAAHSMHYGAFSALGQKYLLGLDGIRQNSVEAFRLLKVSALGKDPRGMFLFGKMILDHPTQDFNLNIGNSCLSGFACQQSSNRLNVACQLCGASIGNIHIACVACNFDICNGCQALNPSLQDITATVLRRRSFFLNVIALIQKVHFEMLGSHLPPEKNRIFYLTSLTEVGANPSLPDKFDSKLPNYKVDRFIPIDCRDSMRAAQYMLKCPDFLLTPFKLREAVKMVGSAALSGVNEAQYLYSLLLQNGNNIDVDHESSFDFLSKAATGNHPEAQAKLGEMYLRGIRPAEMDSAQALRFLQPAASARVPLAMFLFGECLEHGVGTEADQKEATRWYGIAADSGHTEAQFRYAVCLEQGKGIAIDTKGAIKYYSLAAKGKHTLAQSRLGSHFKKEDIHEAVKMFRSAADGGNAAAQFELGMLLLTGYGPILKETQNQVEAIVFFQAAAEQNHPDASYYLGCCRVLGIGCRIDYTESRRLLEFAIKHNIPAAMHDLAVSFSKSNDFGSALIHYNAANDARYIEAFYGLATMYFHGQGVSQDYSTACKLFQQGSEAGSARCLFASAFCHMHGVGADLNIQKALIDMETSARQGHPFAQFFMGICLKVGNGVAINASASAYWFRCSARQGFANAEKMMQNAFNAGQPCSLSEVTTATDFFPISHRFSLEIDKPADFKVNSAKVVLHEGLYEKTKGFGGLGLKFLATIVTRKIEVTDSELKWIKNETEIKGTVKVADAVSLESGLRHNEYFGFAFHSFEHERGKNSVRYFWSTDASKIQVLHAVLDLWMSSAKL